jgi:predicted RNase H-like nuclease (RuvC/YqgF family)
MLFKEFESYKSSMRQKIADLEHKLQFEASKDTKIANLEIDKTKLSNNVTDLQKKVELLERKLKAASAGIVEEGGDDGYHLRKESALDESKQLTPGTLN